MNGKIVDLEKLLKTQHGRDLVKESIAEVFHEAWKSWSQNIASNQKIDPGTMGRWSFFWQTNYCEIPEIDKAPEYRLAKKVMTRLGLDM